MTLPVLIVAYCFVIVLASLLGGWLPSLIRLSHVRLQVMMSLVSGLMLGIALLHLLPHAAEHLASMTQVAGAMLAGLLVMFFLLRVFHVHGHGDADHHECGHDHSHHGHEPETEAGPRLHWLGLYFGLSVHTLLDGVALAASVVADAHHDEHVTLALFGFGTFLAVALHKPLDALAITSLMRAGGWSNRSQTFANCGYALMCPLGALLFWLGAAAVGQSSDVIGYALAFSAGFFLCIALGDLLPEVQFHSHDRWKLSVALLAGVALAAAIEMTHSHDGHSADHAHAHGGESDRPKSFAEAVTLITERGDEVAEAFQGGNPDAGHDALHELGHLLVALPELIDEADMATEDQDAAKQAGKELFASYDKLDRLMHGKNADEKKAVAMYAEVQDSIASSLQVLRSKRAALRLAE